MELKTYFAQDASGNIMPGAAVTVYVADTLTLATGLQDENGSPLTNPFNADSDAKVAFYAPDGLYDINVVSGIRNVTLRTQFLDYSDAFLRADLASTASGKGAALVGYDSGTAQDVLDEAKPMANYTALRAYTGRATGVRITQQGIAGLFQRDASDTTSADNGGTIIVDASGRRWKRLFVGDVHVEWFGATGNGIADDAPAVQLAINSVSVAGFGSVKFKPGSTYFLNTQINLCDNLVMWGYGAKLKLGNAWAGINKPLFKNFSGTEFSAPGTRLASKNISFLGFEIDGQDAGIAGALIPNANMHGVIICVGGWGANTGVDGLTVRDCKMYSFAGAGVMAWKSSNIKVSENEFNNFFANVDLSIGSPIDCHEVDRATITRNRINHTASGYSWHGMVVLDWDAGSSNVIIADNIITNMNRGDGISCEGNSLANLTNGIITGNIIKNCAGDGVGVDRCVSVTVTDNTIESITGMGVLFTETEFTTITGNRITTCGLGGIVCRSGVVRSVIAKNTVLGVTYHDTNYRGHGIEVVDTTWADGAQVEITGNIIKDVDGCGVYSPLINALVSGNNIYNAGRSASNVATLRACVFAAAPSFVTDNLMVSIGNTHYAVSSGASDFPSIADNRIRGTFLTSFYYIGYRGTGLYHDYSVSIEEAKYDARTNVFTGRYNGVPPGYWYLGDTMYATQPAAAGYIGQVVTATGTTWKTFGAISA